MDEYGPELHFVEGSANVVADTFSWLSRNGTLASHVVGKKWPADDNNNGESDVNETPFDNYFSWTNDREMLGCFTCLPDEECYFNLPDDMVNNNPLDKENIKEQQEDDALLQQGTNYVDCYTRKWIGIVNNILCYVKPRDLPNNLKIALPKALMQPKI